MAKYGNKETAEYIEAGQDKCANCGKTYSMHLNGTYCRIGSDAKWFPQKLADAIVGSTQKTVECSMPLCDCSGPGQCSKQSPKVRCRSDNKMPYAK